jgi:hypothetical protein
MGTLGSLCGLPCLGRQGGQRSARVGQQAKQKRRRALLPKAAFPKNGKNGSGGCEGLVEIGEDVVDVLDADG